MKIFLGVDVTVKLIKLKFKLTATILRFIQVLNESFIPSILLVRQFSFNSFKLSGCCTGAHVGFHK